MAMMHVHRLSMTRVDCHSGELHLFCFFFTSPGDGELADKAALRAAALGRLPSAPSMPACKQDELNISIAHNMQPLVV